MAVPYNNIPFDWWSVMHFVGGAMLKRTFGLSKEQALKVVIGYEILENIIFRRLSGRLFGEDEGLVNAVSDIGFGMAGWSVA